MLPKTFLENHFTGEVINNLFVAMASDGTHNNKIKAIREVIGNDEYFDEVVYIQDDPSTNDITYKIFDNIAKDKTLLFDLSNDARLCTRPLKKADKVNANVMYELGVALTIRNSNSIILVRKESDGQLKKVPFDISGITIHPYKNFDKNFLVEVFNDQKENKGYFNKQLIEGVAKLIDELGLAIIHWALKQDKDKRNFPIISMASYIRKTFNEFRMGDKVLEYFASNEEVRMSVFRLLDLGILKKEDEYTPDFGHSYHWTEFGKEILEYVEKKQKKGTTP